MSAVILVIGATGVFGSRLVERLAISSEATILAASRSANGLAALIERLKQQPLKAQLRACVLDREQVTAETLRALGANIVVDAAGPFQGQHLRLPEAAIQAGCHCIDLADARDYVTRFPQLDAAARRAGVLAVTGASSTPAVSHAALDRLVADVHQLDEASVYISPGNRAPRGVAVVKAILSYVGRPVRVREAGAMRLRAGWSSLHRRRLDGLGSRWFALCETPDLDLIPERFASVLSARFYAGLELAILHCGLWLLGWLVRLRCVRSLESWAVPLHWVASRFERFGTDRGGMLVEASGRDACGARVTARWQLIAEAGHGPYVPVLPALALIRKLIAGRELTVGARACVGLLSLTDIVAEIGDLRIRTYHEAPGQRSVVRSALGEAFDAMPRTVQLVHSARAKKIYGGRAQVDGASRLCGSIIARIFGFPRATANCSVAVTITPQATYELWQRQFAKARFSSRLCPGEAPGTIVERFGPIRVLLKVAGDRDGFSMRVDRCKLWLLPVPRALAPWTIAHERVDERGRFTFDVEIGIAWLGRLVRYRGWLEERSTTAPDTDHVTPNAASMQRDG